MTYERLSLIYWSSIATIVIAALLYILFSEKHVHSYYLGSESLGSSGGLSLVIDIENSLDERVLLTGMSVENAVKLVDSLNLTIKK